MENIFKNYKNKKTKGKKHLWFVTQKMIMAFKKTKRERERETERETERDTERQREKPSVHRQENES